MKGGIWYRTRRKWLGLTQAELAERLGVDHNTISRRELGQVPISKEAELAIESLLDEERHAEELEADSNNQRDQA